MKNPAAEKAGNTSMAGHRWAGRKRCLGCGGHAANPARAGGAHAGKGTRHVPGSAGGEKEKAAEKIELEPDGEEIKYHVGGGKTPDDAGMGIPSTTESGVRAPAPFGTLGTQVNGEVPPKSAR